MATLKQPKTEEEVKGTPVSQLRKDYNVLASEYNKMLDGHYLLCGKCNTFQRAETGFYLDDFYSTKRYPICKRCLQMMVEQKKRKSDEPNETKKSVQKVLRLMNRVYDEKFYTECVKGALDENKEKNRNSPFATYITAIQSLPNWKGKTWEDSYFEDDDNVAVNVNENSRIVKSGRKRFGMNYLSEELYWLENEYQDWVARYPCDSKAQETLFKTLCCQELEREQLRKKGKSTKDIDAAIQNTMAALGIKPSQSKADALADTLTMGQLIEKWETEKPVPEPEDEFKDVDKIGIYIDVFFKGHLAKMMGLKNAFSLLYEKFMEKYTVHKPEENEEDEEVLFNQIFGSKLDKEGD